MKKEGIKLSSTSKRLAFKDNSLFDTPQNTPVIIDEATNQVESISILNTISFQDFFEEIFHRVKEQVLGQIYKLKTYLWVKIKSLPWTKFLILFAVAYVLLHKDMTFSVDLKSPVSIFMDDQENNGEIRSVDKFAQPITVSQKNNPSKRAANPYAPASVAEIDPVAKAYIKKYGKIAVAEMKKYDIPASIKLAQALLESHAGRSRLARENNNHFGVKCFSKNCKKGHCSNFNDDHHKDFFRKYTSSWKSYRSHSIMIVSGRYKPLLKHGKNYKKWAKGLKKLGYATDKNYHKKLIKTIEKYELYKLDKFK